MAEKNTPKEVTRGGATLNEGWLVGQNIVQDVGDEGGSVEHPLSKNQTVAKLLTPPLRDNARVAAQDVVHPSSKNHIVLKIPTPPLGDYARGAAQDVKGEATTDGEGGGSVGHSSSKNHSVVKLPTPPLQDYARVATRDVKGEATTDGEGGGSVGHSSSKNHSVVKLRTPPLRDYAPVAARDVKGEATTDGEGGGSIGHPSLENYTIAKFLTPPLQDNTEVAVVMVPLPAQGHLNQLLHLSRLISMYNIQVYYIGNTSHIQQAKIRAHVFDPLTITNIHFHEFHQTPSFETPLPNPNASFKYPNHLLPLFYATFHLREPVSLLVRELVTVNHRKVVVIYDSLMAFVVQGLPQIPNIECYCFNSSSAFFFYSYIWEFKGKPFHPGTENYEDIPTNVDCFPPEFWEFFKIQEQFDGKISCGELFNSSRVIESLYLDLMAKEYDGVKQWAIGPFNPMKPQEMSKYLNKRHESLDWLDKQERDSVIFVSFGTTISLCDEEIKVLAIGLEKSRQKFVWVLRDADKGDIFTSEDRKVQLPEGYEERIKERGIIVRDWAPQLEILAHSSTGGFLSHCGWNSCMESMSCGVPIAAWPMHSDQPRNSQLVTNYLKIGLIVRPWTRRDEVVTSDIVENAVKTLMASPEGDEMRKRAADLSNAIKKSVTDGGINRAEMDSFISHITR